MSGKKRKKKHGILNLEIVFFFSRNSRPARNTYCIVSYPYCVPDITNDYDGFTFLRHPFVRLLSAYQGKVVNTKNYFPGLFNVFQSANASQEYRPPSFSSFVDLLLRGLHVKTSDWHVDSFIAHCRMCEIELVS